MDRRIYMFLFTWLLLTACTREKDQFTEPAIPGHPSSGTVSLCFRLSGRIADTRTSEEEPIQKEESEVQSLCYAIFKENMFEVGAKKDLTNEHLQTGGQYLVSNLDKELFDETTEIFAIANLSGERCDTLLNLPPPDLTNSLEHPLLQAEVGDYMDRQAKISTYDFLISGQLINGNYPSDNKMHFLPANKANYVAKQYNLASENISFNDYATLIENRNKETDMGKRAVYDMIVDDLECRLPLYHAQRYRDTLNAYKAREETDNTYSRRLAQDPAFTRYVQWHDLVHRENLNITSAGQEERLIPAPAMAGYLALTNTPGSIITVPVEHIYSRLWFQFSFTGETTAPDIEIEQIEVIGLPQLTKVFNTSSISSENNLSGALEDEAATVSISRENLEQSPFLGNLSKTEGPWHLDRENDGDIHLLCYDPAYPDYKTVCRYPYKTGTTELDTDNPPVRYYLYSYQWYGATLADDPLIRVTYRYASADAGTVVRKTASARLYDESHSGGKLHHGVLRNYTYKVNCQINTASHNLELQIIPHDWYHLEVDDIPSFD